MGRSLSSKNKHTAWIELDIRGVADASADHPRSSSNVNGALKKYFCLFFHFGCLNYQFAPAREKALMLSKHKMQTLVSTSVLISTNSEHSGVVRHGFMLGRHC